MTKTNRQRGVETVEWVAVAAFLAVGTIGGYKLLATSVHAHNARIGDCVGGAAECGPGGGGTAGGGGTGTSTGALTGGGGGTAGAGGATGSWAPGGGTMSGSSEPSGDTFTENFDWMGTDANGSPMGGNGGLPGPGGPGAATEGGEQGWGSWIWGGIKSGASNTWSFGKGVVVDGAGGAIVGTWDLGVALVTDPQGTVEGIASGIGNAVMNPGETFAGVRDNFNRAWEEDPARALGAGAFEIASILIPVTKASTVSRVANAAHDAADAGAAVIPATRVVRPNGVLPESERLASIDCAGGVCTRPGQCFAAGTPVVTQLGERPIERIAVGDLVLARDPETGETKYQRVAETFVRESPVVDLTLAADGTFRRAEHLVVTAEHPFHVHGGGFRTVAELAPGDEVDTATGTAKVVALASLPDRVTVYNFEVDHDHTYFVGHLKAWVHNVCGENLPPDHGTVVPDGVAPTNAGVTHGITVTGIQTSDFGRIPWTFDANTPVFRMQQAGFDMEPHVSPYFDPEQYGYGARPASDFEVLYVSTNHDKLAALRGSQSYADFDDATMRETTLGTLVEQSGPGTRVFVDHRLPDHSIILVREVGR